MFRRIACATIMLAGSALACGAASAEITPQQHLGCAVSYMTIETALKDHPAAPEWRERTHNSMTGLKMDGHLTNEQVLARVSIAGNEAVTQYNDGDLTPAKVAADVKMCDYLYGFAPADSVSAAPAAPHAHH